MKIAILILGIAVLTAGCAQNGSPIKATFYSDVCDREVDGISPPSPTVITYGEKNKKKILEVRTKSNVKKNTEFHLRLKRENNSQYGVNYDDALVTVKGVLTKGSVTGSNATWINASGSYTSLAAKNHILIAGCVPVDAAEGDFYLFDVTVDNLGKLDPRAEVVR